MNSRQQHFLMRITALAAVSLLCGCALASRDLALDDFAQPADKNTAPPVQESQDKQPAPTPAEKPPAEKPVPQQPPPTEKATPEELPPPAAETSTRGTTLREIEELVREHHPRLYSATAAISAAAGRARQVGRPPNPNIGASSPQWAGPQSQYNAFISQDILTGGKLQLNSAAAGVEVEQMQMERVTALFEVLTVVRKQFYATLAMQHRVRELHELQILSNKSVELAQKLLAAGEGSRPDVLILEVEADKVEFAYTNAKNSLKTALRQLAVVAGVPHLNIEAVSGELDIEFPELDWLVIQESVEQNAALARADAEIRRSRILVERAIVEPSPKLNVMGGYQRQVEPAQDQGLFQVTMSVPLWDKNRGGIQAARANFRQAHADFAQTQFDLTAQANDALKRYQNATQEVQKYEQEILPRTRESVQLTQQLYEKGQADFLDLLAVQRTAQEADLNLINAQEARAAAAADLGGLLQMEEFP